MKAPVAPGNLIPVDGEVRTLRLRHHRGLACRPKRARSRFGEVHVPICDRDHTGVGHAQHSTFPQIDDGVEPFDWPTPHVGRRPPQVIASDLDDPFAGVIGNREVSGRHRRAEDFLGIADAALGERSAELRVGPDDLRDFKLGQHHRRFDALALHSGDEPSRCEIDDDFEHTRGSHDDQTRLTWQRRSRPPRDNVGLRRLVEQDRRELRACEAGIRSSDLGGHTDFVRRQRIEWVSGDTLRQKEHANGDDDRQRPSSDSHRRPHLRLGAGVEVGDVAGPRVPRVAVPQKMKPPRLVPAMMSIAPSLLRSAT